jgi:hypothetical protein
LQELVARRYGYNGPFCANLLKDLRNPYRREFLINSLSIKTGSDLLFDLLAEHYPEMLQSLFDAVGTVTARSHGMNIKSIFKKKAKKEQFRFVQLPDGTTAKIRNF